MDTEGGRDRLLWLWDCGGGVSWGLMIGVGFVVGHNFGCGLRVRSTFAFLLWVAVRGRGRWGGRWGMVLSVFTQIANILVEIINGDIFVVKIDSVGRQSLIASKDIGFGLGSCLPRGLMPWVPITRSASSEVTNNGESSHLRKIEVERIVGIRAYGSELVTEFTHGDIIRSSIVLIPLKELIKGFEAIICAIEKVCS